MTKLDIDNLGENHTLTIDIEGDQGGGTVGPFVCPEQIALKFVEIANTCKEFWKIAVSKNPDRYREIRVQTKEISDNIKTLTTESLPILENHLPEIAIRNLIHKTESVYSAQHTIEHISEDDYPALVYLDTGSETYGPIDCKVKTATLIQKLGDRATSIKAGIKILESNIELPNTLQDLERDEEEFRSVWEQFTKEHRILLKKEDSSKILIYINEIVIHLNTIRNISPEETERLREQSEDLRKNI